MTSEQPQSEPPDAELWERVKRIVARAIELPTGERSRFIDAECGDDAARRQDVEKLLLAYDGASAGRFLAQPTAEGAGNGRRIEVLHKQVAQHRSRFYGLRQVAHLAK